MVITLRLKNFFSLSDETVLDFTAETSPRRCADRLSENLIEFGGDRFVNIIGLFGSNAAGKSNLIKAVDFCRNLVLNSHLSNEGDEFDFEPFKFGGDEPSEFLIDFVTGGIEYEYSFALYGGKVLSESLYYFPNRRRAKVFSRDRYNVYTYRKGIMSRPAEVEANTSSKTLFISRASSMNRPIAQEVYRFFLNEMVVGVGSFDLTKLTYDRVDADKDLLLKAFEVSDSDIVDIRLFEPKPGMFRLQSFHKENPEIAFDFEKEESEGTKRLLFILLILLRKSLEGATIFLDEFDLKLHLRLSEFLLDVVRASKKAQLVFTSHNSSLINLDKLRSEQIVFVNKQPDGNSEFVPLSDYEGIGKNTDIQKAYLQGRFDAVPYIGDINDIYRTLTVLLDRK